MAPSYTLTYFDGRGRAEIIRLVFAHAGVAFEDKRIGFEDWPKVKPTTPLGGLPMLEFKGKKFGQAIAIASYLAREFGLYGKTNEEGLMIDQIQQQKEDLLAQMIKVKFAKDDATKAENQKALEENALPTTFQFFCDVIKKNGGSGYAVGSKLTLADLVIYEASQFCVEDSSKSDLLDKYPEIRELRSHVEAGDNIKKYLAARKKTSF